MNYFVGPNYHLPEWIEKGYVKLVKTKTSICKHFVFKSCPEDLKKEMREENKQYPTYLFEEDLTEEELKAIKPCDGKPY